MIESDVKLKLVLEGHMFEGRAYYHLPRAYTAERLDDTSILITENYTIETKDGKRIERGRRPISKEALIF